MIKAKYRAKALKMLRSSLTEEKEAVKDYRHKAKMAKCKPVKKQFRELAHDESVHVKEISKRIRMIKRRKR